MNPTPYRRGLRQLGRPFEPFFIHSRVPEGIALTPSRVEPTPATRVEGRGE